MLQCDFGPALYFELRNVAIRISELCMRAVRSKSIDFSLKQWPYLLDQMKALEAIPIVSSTNAADIKAASASLEALQYIEKNIPAVLSGSFSLDQLVLKMHRQFGVYFWKKLMMDPPVGTYARACSDVILRQNLLGSDTLELGSGVGHLTSLLPTSDRQYVISDKDSRHFKGWNLKSYQYDFDNPPDARKWDTIIGSLCLHCAKDKAQTFRFLYEALKPGGRLILAEGQNHVRGLEPWSLNLLFGLYDGWWNRGGFQDRQVWKEQLYRAGFEKVESESITLDEYDFGGVIWAEKK